MSENERLTPERLAEIRALRAKVTPGNWSTHEDGTCKCGMVWADETALVHIATNFEDDDIIPDDAQQVANAAFIAAAPGIVDELMAERQRLFLLLVDIWRIIVDEEPLQADDALGDINTIILNALHPELADYIGFGKDSAVNNAAPAPQDDAAQEAK